MDMNIEKRRFGRVGAGLFKSLLVHENRHYEGVVENMCDRGLHLIIASKLHISALLPEVSVKLKIQSVSGTEKDIHCEIKWIHMNSTPIYGLTYRMGMEITAASAEYLQLLSSFSGDRC